MERRDFLKKGSLMALTTSIYPLKRIPGNINTPKTFQNRKKNILLFIGDNLGKDLGCYGNPIIKTPNIDRLSRDSVRFSHAFTAVNASCSPSRSTIYTGLYNHTNGQYGLEHPPHNFKTHLWVKSVPNILNTMGYHTGLIGKYNLGPREVYNFNEIIDGFPTAEKAKKFFISEPDRPFLLSVCYRPQGDPDIKKTGYSPDEMIVPPCLPDFPEVREDLVKYYERVSNMDQSIGPIIKALKESGREKDTMIMFFTDGGAPFPGMGYGPYDSGIHCPLIISTPNLKKKGIVNNAMVSWIDIVPTILDWAGMKAPYNIESPGYRTPDRLLLYNPETPIHRGSYTLPGRSILPVLEEENPPGWDTIFASHTYHEVTMYYPMRVIRTRKFKYILNIAHELPYPLATDIFRSGSWQSILDHNVKMMGARSIDSFRHRPEEELYDLEKDTNEVNNLAYDPEYSDIINNFRSQIKYFQELTEDIWLLKRKY